MTEREVAPPGVPIAPVGDTKVAGELRARVAAGETVTAIVTFDDVSSEAASRLAVGDLAAAEARPLVALRREDFSRMKKRALATDGLRVVHELVELPTSVVEVSSLEALEALEASADVLSAQPEGSFTPQMDSSTALIESAAANSLGYQGNGATVAVLDTGVDYTYSPLCTPPAGTCSHGACDLGGALVAGCDPCVAAVCASNAACCGTTWNAACIAAVPTICDVSCNDVNPGADFEPEGASCRVDYARDFAPADGFRDDTATQFALHGTAVANVIARVAPQAHIVALDVFRAGTATVLESDVLAAMDWVLANATTYNIKVVNLSFGSGAFTSPCPTHNLAASIDALRSAGILTVAASGNDGRPDALMGPACVPNAVSVGAVYDTSAASTAYWGCTDSPLVSTNVPCFSNAASFLDLVAPGTNVVHPDFVVNDGVANSTSIAAAHASGVAALVAGGFTGTTPAQWEKRLRYGGPFGTDPRISKTYNLLNARGSVGACTVDVSPREASYDNLGGSGALTVDVEPSTCSFQVNNAFTSFITVSGAASTTPPPQGSCSHDLCTTGEPIVNDCSPPCSVDLCAFDPVCCDPFGVYDGLCVARVAIACGSSGYSCSDGGTTFTGAQSINYTVAAGSVTRSGFLSFPGAGAIFGDNHVVRQGPFLGPPEVTNFVINANATYATTNIATLTSAATDGTAVAEMCISSTPNCTAWQPYTTTRTVGLSAGDGVKTVYGRFRDDFDNAGQLVSDTIILDTTPPANGTLTVTSTSGQNALSWTGFSDATSGLASYKLVVSSVSAPANCSTGTVLLNNVPTATTTHAHAGLANGTTYYYRLCATDNAGKISAGVAGTGRPAPEFVPPTGTVAINAGATFTASGVVTLNLTATDASGVTGVCVNQTGLSCTAWQTYPVGGTVSTSLASGPGQKTVHVWFRDLYNNVSTSAATDTILLDLQVAGVTAVAGNGVVTVTWATAAGAPTGTSGYDLRRSTSPTAASCADGTQVYTGTANTFADTTVTNGTLYYYRACLIQTGTLAKSIGREVSGRPKPESVAPTGTVSIAAGAAYTKLTTVTLTLTATDAGGGAIEMCVTNSTVCTTFEPFATTKSWTVLTGSGTKTVRVFLRDQWLNTTTSAQAASDTIVLDTTPPTNGTVTSTNTGTTVRLTWSGFSDSLSGLASYKVVYAANLAPASCSVGTVLAETTTALTVTHSGVTAGSKWGYRVCARDTLGNMSSGATRVVTIPTAAP